jgi:hypothetical protein
VDALWDQIEACWHDDPEQRPSAFTVLQFLQGLSEERIPQEEPQEFLELTDDEAWDCIEDAPELRTFSFSGSEPLD